MDIPLPTTKHSPKLPKSMKRRIRDPRDAVQIIKMRSKGMNPIFHHAQSLARLIVGLAFILTANYVVNEPGTVTRHIGEAVAYVNSHISLESITASVLSAFGK